MANEIRKKNDGFEMQFFLIGTEQTNKLLKKEHIYMIESF